MQTAGPSPPVMPRPDPSDRSASGLPPGTLEMLILRTLTVGSLHGYAIAQHIAKLSDGVFRVEQGSLYPALERVLNKGWATVRWAETPTKRQARYYSITPSGRKQLKAKMVEYERTSTAIARVMAAR
jgi:PadR family transcriptional regulator, regulatory protein PadR